jgi:hypothetical protein
MFDGSWTIASGGGTERGIDSDVAAKRWSWLRVEFSGLILEEVLEVKNMEVGHDHAVSMCGLSMCLKGGMKG